MTFQVMIYLYHTHQQQSTIFRIDFPPEVVRGESLFTNMVIDETSSQPSGNCDDVFVYITDTVEPGNARRSMTQICRYVIHPFRNHA